MAAGPSGRGCNLVVVLGRLRGASAPARTRGRLIFRLDCERRRSIGADRRRKHVQRQAVVVNSVHSRAAVFILVGLVGAALLTEGATIPVTVTVPVATTVAAVEALAAIAPALTVLVAAVGFGRFHLLLALILIEGFAISVVGGIIGLGLGVLTMNVVSWTRLSAGLLEPYMTTSLAVQALIAVLLAGPIGAIYPAWRATRLRPADALRRN